MLFDNLQIFRQLSILFIGELRQSRFTVLLAPYGKLSRFPKPIQAFLVLSLRIIDHHAVNWRQNERKKKAPFYGATRGPDLCVICKRSVAEFFQQVSGKEILWYLIGHIDCHTPSHLHSFASTEH